jgi:hypothetical protein
MAELDDSVDSPAFVRQRRNLILASLMLAFAQGTHLTIERLNLFGISGRIDEPVSTVPFLWIVWGYFLWRYWQAFWAFTRKPTKDLFKKIKKKYVQAVARKKALSQFEGQKVELSGVSRTGKPEPDAWMPADEETKTPTGATVTMVTNVVGDPGTGQRNVEVELSAREMRMARLKAKLELAFTSNELSEFYLPYAIAAIPIGVWAWQFLRSAGMCRLLV